MKQQVNLESHETLRILANIKGSRREFAEIYSAALGLKSGYQTLVNAIRAKKGMTAKQASSFLHNLRHAEAGSNLEDYKAELQYAYYLLDYFMETGVLERDEEMKIDAITPFEERQLERRFGDGYEPTGDGNVEGLSDDREEGAEEESTSEKSEDVQGESEGDRVSSEEVDEEVVVMIRDKDRNVVVNPTPEEVENFEKTGEIKQESNDVDDVLAQLLSFSATKPKEVTEKSNDFLTNFLGEPTKVSMKPNVSSDSFDNNLENIPDVFDRESKKF